MAMRGGRQDHSGMIGLFHVCEAQVGGCHSIISSLTSLTDLIHGKLSTTFIVCIETLALTRQK
jgi:hypothetical protein